MGPTRRLGHAPPLVRRLGLALPSARRLAPPLVRRLALPLAVAVSLAAPAVSAATCTTTFTARFAAVTNGTGAGCAVTDLAVSPNPLDPGVDPSLTATFDGSGSVDADGVVTGIASYVWAFGDGTSATTVVGVDPNPAMTTHPYPHRGLYVATLTTKDSGHLDIASSDPVDVYVSAPPVAVLGVPAGVLRPGAAASFDATGSSAPGGSIDHYEWNWGDGSAVQVVPFANGPQVQHTFAADGASTHVTLTVVNDLGLKSAPVTHAITVQNQLPLVQLIATPSTVTVGQQLTLSAAGSSDPDGSIVEYRWDLDANGSFETTTGTSPQVTAGPYPNAGVLHPRVEVIDDSGGASILSVPVTVLDPTGGGSGGSGSGGSGGGSHGAGGGSGGSGSGSSGGGTSGDAFVIGLSGNAIQRLTSALRRGVGLLARANRAAKGTLTLTISARDARALHLAKHARKPVAIGTLRLKLRAGRTAKPSIKLTRAAARALRHAHLRTLRITIRGTLTAGTVRASAVRIVLLRG